VGKSRHEPLDLTARGIVCGTVEM